MYTYFFTNTTLFQHNIYTLLSSNEFGVLNLKSIHFLFQDIENTNTIIIIKRGCCHVLINTVMIVKRGCFHVLANTVVINIKRECCHVLTNTVIISKSECFPVLINNVIL